MRREEEIRARLTHLQREAEEWQARQEAGLAADVVRGMLGFIGCEQAILYWVLDEDGDGKRVENLRQAD